MKIPVGGPLQTRMAQSGEARGSATGPRCRICPRANESTVGTGFGVLPRSSHGFPDPSSGASRQVLIAALGRPQQSSAYLGRPAGLSWYGARPPEWGASPVPQPPQQAEERQQGAQRSGRPIALIPARRSLRSGEARGYGQWRRRRLHVSGPPRVPRPPVRSSPKLFTGARRGPYTPLTQPGVRQGTGF
ncbi:hypothetical protein NDU88_006187 [Pleurodeles waltl]|uniref:Uncharacterized protein n=1 Tax=Pleurodeles waltl TaxID=8319 RepID=A0AAV7VM44_PLEWA|nr:hypothetical protein NDU88_006187 [Pleurodeles waltl]